MLILNSQGLHIKGKHQNIQNFTAQYHGSLSLSTLGLDTPLGTVKCGEKGLGKSRSSPSPF